MWHQWDFFQAREEGYDYRWLSGGVGTGKTDMALIEDLILATEICPGKRGLIVVPDFPTFDDVLLPKIEQWWPKGIYRLYRGSGRPSIHVKTKKGTSKILVRSAHDYGQVRKIVGFEVAWAHMEEMARMRYGEMAWDLTNERVRQKAPYNGIHVSSTPIPGFLPEIFGVEDGIPKVALVEGICSKVDTHWDEMRQKLHKFRYWVRRARVEDNFHNPPEYAARLRGRFHGDFAKQELDGQVVGRSGRIFPGWMEAMHVIPNELADKMWRHIRSARGAADWGYTMPAACLLGGWLPDGEFLAIDEWYKPQQTTEQQGYAAIQLQQRWLPRKKDLEWRCDPAEPESIQKWNGGFMLDNPENGQYERFRLRAFKANNAWRPGIDGINMLLARRGGTRHPTDNPGETTGAPRFYVAERCVNLRREMRAYKRKMSPDGQPMGDNETVGEDHLIDCARYLVNAEGLGLHYSGLRPEDLD